MAKRLSCLTLLALCGCGADASQPVRVPPWVVATPPAATAPQASPGSPEPIRVPQPFPPGFRNRELKLPEVSARASGFRITTAVTDRGTFLGDGNAVRGPLAAPVGEVFVFVAPVGKDDETLFALTRSGQSYRAPLTTGALPQPSAWVRGPRIDAAATFDAAGDVVAVASGDSVHISLDGGVTFTAQRPKARSQVGEVFARVDGVVVALVPGKVAQTFVSKSGRAFDRASYQPASLVRTGARIHSADACRAALAADGKSWLAPHWPQRTGSARRNVDITARAAAEPFADPFGMSPFEGHELDVRQRSAPTPPPRRATPSSPAAPRDVPANQRASGSAVDCGDGSASLMLGMLSTKAAPCKGGRCLINADLPHTPSGDHVVAAFNDGHCAERDTELRTEGGETWRQCKRSAPFVHAPTLAVMSSSGGPLLAVRPPDDCAVSGVYDGRGIAFIGCEVAGGTKLLGVTADGRFTDEGGLPGASGQLSISVGGDGAVVLRTESGLYFARPAAELGSGARFAPLGGDHVYAMPIADDLLLVARVGRTDAELQFGLERRGAFQPLGRPFTLDSNVIELQLGARDEIHLTLHPQMMSRHDMSSMIQLLGKTPTTEVIVRQDGVLEPLPPPPRR